MFSSEMDSELNLGREELTETSKGDREKVKMPSFSGVDGNTDKLILIYYYFNNILDAEK
jgi:hypothetical protein